MKRINWKELILTCLACLTPILYGIYLWDRLPQRIAVHFNFYSQPDHFASKGFGVFGLPALVMLFQAFCCICTDLDVRQRGMGKKVERVVKWMIPFLNLVIYVSLLGYALGWQIDIRKVACLVVGIIFLVTGNYLPKTNYVKNKTLDSEQARKLNRLYGYGLVILGFLFLISIFLPPLFSVICLLLLIPYTGFCAVWSIKAGKKKEEA